MSARLGRYPTRLDGQGPTATLAPPIEHTTDDLAVLERLDPEHDLDCCKQSCEQHADWYRRCRSCGAIYPICEYHYRGEMSWFVLQAIIGCVECPGLTAGVRWFDLFDYIPIGSHHGS